MLWWWVKLGDNIRCHSEKRKSFCDIWGDVLPEKKVYNWPFSIWGWRPMPRRLRIIAISTSPSASNIPITDPTLLSDVFSSISFSVSEIQNFLLIQKQLIQACLSDGGLTIPEAKKCVKDRREWRRIVKGRWRWSRVKQVVWNSGCFELLRSGTWLIWRISVVWVEPMLCVCAGWPQLFGKTPLLLKKKLVNVIFEFDWLHLYSGAFALPRRSFLLHPILFLFTSFACRGYESVWL